MTDEMTYEDRPTGAAKHGNYFFGVNERGRIVMFYADKVTVEPGGVLCAYRKRDDEWQMTLAWVPGEWSKFWAASVLEGNAIAIDSIHPYPSEEEIAKKPAKKKGGTK